MSVGLLSADEMNVSMITWSVYEYRVCDPLDNQAYLGPVEKVAKLGWKVKSEDMTNNRLSLT
jgi:hypothetical protein